MRSGRRCASPGCHQGNGMPGTRPAEKKLRIALLPVSSILRAFRAPAFRCFCATGHLDSFPVNECIGNFPAGFVQVAPRGLAGDPEFFCRLFLFKSFEIDEPYQFDLIGLERDSLPLLRVAAGFVAATF
jgi:hypothetical protein